MGKTLVWFGGLGASLGLLCCFTGLLPFVLTTLGASALIDVLYKDSVLLPFAGISFVVLLTGLWVMKTGKANI